MMAYRFHNDGDLLKEISPLYLLDVTIEMLRDRYMHETAPIKRMKVRIQTPRRPDPIIAVPAFRHQQWTSHVSVAA